MAIYKEQKNVWDSFSEATPRSWANNYMAFNTLKIPTKHVIPPMQWEEKETRGIPLTETSEEILGERQQVPDFSEYCSDKISFVS